MDSQELDELYSAIATYMPDRQIITFKEGMQVAPRTGSGPSHFTGEQTGYFFHEWIHYLHNVSTAHGITAFANLVQLWSAFRSTTDAHGFGQGETLSAPEPEFKVKERLELLFTTRMHSGPTLPTWATPDRCRVTAHTPATGSGFGSDFIAMDVEISNTTGEVTTMPTSVGALEILESVAFLLEKRFVNALGGEPSTVPVVPYHSLALLARHVAPALSEEDVLVCGLASLQYTFPAQAIGYLLAQSKPAAAVGESVQDRVRGIVIGHLQESHATLQAIFEQMKATFPLDVGFGRAAKETVAIMRRNLDVRLTRPFFELDLIEEIRARGIEGFSGLMDKFMQTYGVCSCQQVRPGFLDDLGRDALFEFSIAGRDDDLNEARRVMQASFEFLARHFSKGGTLRSTLAARSGPCLFYTSCHEDARRDRAADCRDQPWITAKAPGRKCWYAKGVLQLGPGAPALASSQGAT